MLLYQGSKSKFNVLKPQQAQAGEGVEVPEGELLNAIYLTPDLGYAIASGARPHGLTHINDDRTIEFENPELYDPNEEIFLYVVDSDSIPKENMREIDSQQIAVVDLPELVPESMQELKAGEVEKYFEIKDFVKEDDRETNHGESRK